MQLTKHHGLGNDFLVLMDYADATPAGSDLARTVCNRTTGIGADGLIRASGHDEADARMELWNSDGSPAELSGNGLRCLGQALLLHGVVTDESMTIATAGGLHPVTIKGTEDPHVHDVTADLGSVELEGEAPDWLLPGVVDAAFARLENPHLVLFTPEPSTAPDLDEVGQEANRKVDGGVNVEMIRRARDELIMDVYERGAGRTQACGTGACAAAAVAHSWGVVGRKVVVRMPGGAATVEVGETATLTSPIAAVARLEHPWP
jgi:diaminopimelate epimerase